MLMTLLGRDVPESPAELIFNDHEISFLEDYAATFHLQPPEDLAAAVLLVAIFGGYQNRKHDPPPGNQIMWRGLERLNTATLGAVLHTRERPAAHSSRTNSGYTVVACGAAAGWSRGRAPIRLASGGAMPEYSNQTIGHHSEGSESAIFSADCIPSVARWVRRLWREREAARTRQPGTVDRKTHRCCSFGGSWPARRQPGTVDRASAAGAQPAVFGAGVAHPEDELPAALDQADCVIQRDTSDPLPGRPGEVFVQAPPCGQRVQVVGQQGSQPPGGICPDTTARHGAVGEAVLERIMGSLGVAATTVGQAQDRLRGHRLRPEPVPAALARRRDVGDQYADGVGRLAVLGRQFVIVDAQRIRPPRRRSRLQRRTAM